MNYLYLHGFASGPGSRKAQYLRSQFQSHHQTLQIPDLNQPDFSTLTLSRQIQQGSALVQDDTILIGSSFGGLTSAWIAEQPGMQSKIHKLILLAPAFQFLNQWLPRLGPVQLTQWQETGWLSVYHYDQDQQQPLHYEFVTDAQQYDDTQLRTPIPTLILHGRQDEVIEFEASQTYASTRPWVTLQALDTDHAMTHAMSEIWQAIEGFCAIG